jgi:hypothetical protein
MDVVDRCAVASMKVLCFSRCPAEPARGASARAWNLEIRALLQRVRPPAFVERIRRLLWEQKRRGRGKKVAALQPLLGVLGNNRNEEGAVVDLMPNLLIAGIPAQQLALVEKNLDAGGPQCVANLLGSLRIL